MFESRDSIWIPDCGLEFSENTYNISVDNSVLTKCNTDIKIILGFTEELWSTYWWEFLFEHNNGPPWCPWEWVVGQSPVLGASHLRTYPGLEAVWVGIQDGCSVSHHCQSCPGRRQLCGRVLDPGKNQGCPTINKQT